MQAMLSVVSQAEFQAWLAARERTRIQEGAP